VGTVESRLHRARSLLLLKLKRALGRSFEVSA
jgi:DNA-directed RNA polymerase specialized sigma24 family protein